MLPLISPAAMRDMEQRYFAGTGTPSIDLMERAARALTVSLSKRYGLDKLITEQLNIETTLADEPELCTAHGLENLLEDPDRYDLIDLYSDRRRGEG